MNNLDRTIYYLILYLAIFTLVPIITVWIYKLIYKKRKDDKKLEFYWREVKSNAELRKKLDNYSMAETLVMLVIWIIILISLLVGGMGAFPVMSTNAVNFFTISLFLCFFILIISFFGPSSYLSEYLVGIVFKLRNPELNLGLLRNYSFKMFDKNFQYSVTNLKANPVSGNRFLAKWMTIVTLIVVLLSALLIYFFA